MWPKLLMQLFELLPHVTRLVPVADRYFSSKAAGEKANEAALVAMAEGVRGDLGQVTKAHAGLYRQLQEQNAQIVELSEELKRTRLSVAQVEHRMETLWLQVGSNGRWLKVGFSLTLVMLAVVIGLLLRH